MSTKGKQLRAVGYCRTSGEGQRDNTSIPTQKKCIEDFCQRSDWRFAHHYVDECKSGATVTGRDSFQQMMKEPTFNASVMRALPTKREREEIEKEKDGMQRSVGVVEKEIARLVEAIVKGADPSLLIGKQIELKERKGRICERLAKIEARLSSMPDGELLQSQATTIRLQILQQVQERNWRELPFEEVRRFLIFLFGENPAATGAGIEVRRESGRWRIAFQGKVGFQHELADGRAHPLAGKTLAAVYKQEVQARFKQVVNLKRQT